MITMLAMYNLGLLADFEYKCISETGAKMTFITTSIFGTPNEPSFHYEKEDGTSLNREPRFAVIKGPEYYYVHGALRSDSPHASYLASFTRVYDNTDHVAASMKFKDVRGNLVATIPFECTFLFR